jgi:hypothetical protein
MTVLPIIERELRGRARSRAVYWTRFAVALAGMLVCLPQLMGSGPFWAPANLGRSLLNGLVSTAFLLSCGACLLTADVISAERREGTLGLLLLTRVNVLDVLLGKLGSAGLTSLCALVAILPMLMLPVLAGGVTGGEAFRKGLVLPNTLFVALAAGLWASAGGYEWLKTARTALLLVSALVLAPGLAGLLLKPLGAVVGLLSPLGAISAAGDTPYKVSKADYWTSLLLVQAIGWALLVAARFRLRSAWREEQGETTASPAATFDWFKEKPRQPLVRPLGNGNPIAWLLQRQRGIQALLWAGALVSLTHYGSFALGLRFLSPRSYASVASPLLRVVTVIESALFAWAASRFFVEARRTGALEVLLTTPCGAREIVSAQWDALKRLLRWPMLVLLAPTLLQTVLLIATMQTSRSFGPGGLFGLHYAISIVVSLVNIFFGVGALCWLGLWFGLRARGQGQAIAWTISLAVGLPFLISILCSILLPMLTSTVVTGRSWTYWIILWLPQAMTLVLYLGLIRLARQRLAGGLGGAEVVRFNLQQFLSCAARDALLAIRKARHWTPS